MSTNRKNRDKPVLRNLVQNRNIQRRSILSLEVKLDTDRLKEINDHINELIGTINRIVSTRNIPYISIGETTDRNNLDRTRVLLRSEASDRKAILDVEREFKVNEGNTFLVELYINDNGYIEIGCVENSNVQETPFSNLVLCDQQFLECALTDVFIDSAMFRSYSFLNQFDVDQCRKFNQIKVSFLKSIYEDFTKVETFYKFNNKRYKYLSFAFFARKSEDEIDLKLLVDLWDRFVSKTYSNETHVEPDVETQISAFVDTENFKNRIIEECQKKAKGAYWILRGSRKPNEKYVAWLTALFGRAKLGRVQIIEFEQLDQYKELLEMHQITAFKIIKQ